MRRNIGLCLAVLLAVGLTACGGDSAGAETQIAQLQEQIAQLTQANQELTEENDQLRQQLNTIGDQTAPAPEPDEGPAGFTELFLGSQVTLDFVDMTVDSASWSDEIKPTDTSSVYSYKADQEGESYFWLCGTMKNTSGAAYSVEDIVSELMFDGKYTYNAYLIADDGGNDFYGDYVNPLSSVKYYIYASVPDELKDTYSSCELRFGFAENFSGSYYDEFDECDYLYTITLTK